MGFMGMGLGLVRPCLPLETAPQWQERGIVAARLSAPYAASGFFANSGGKTEIYEQTSCFMATDATDISILYHHVRNGGVGLGNFTVKARLQRGSMWSGLGADDPVLTWGGAVRSGTIAPGDILESDVSSFSAMQGERILARRHLIFAAAPANFPGSQISIYEGDEVNEIGDGLADRIVSNDWAGGWYSRHGAHNYAHSAPSLILGRSTGERKARLCIINDSIGMGSGDNGALALIGWPARMLADDWPWYLVGNEGLRVADLMSNAAERGRRLALLEQAGISHVLVQAGSNDLGTGRTSAQLLANLVALQDELDQLPMRPRLLATTIMPRTNAANTANYGSDAASSWAERLTFNQAIRDGNGVGYGYLDMALHTEAESDPNLWDTSGGKGSADGIHPNAATHAAAATGGSETIAPLLAVEHYA